MQFTKEGTRKGMDVIWTLDAICFIYLFTYLKPLIYTELKTNLHRPTKIFTIKNKKLKIVAIIYPSTLGCIKNNGRND